MADDDQKQREAKAEISMIQTRLDRLANLLNTPGTRGLEEIQDQAATITGAIRLAIQTGDKSIYRLAKDSGLDKTAISRFVKGERDMTGANLDRLALVLGLKLVEGEKG